MSTDAAGIPTLEFASIGTAAMPGVRSGTAYRATGLEPGLHRGMPSTTLTFILSLDGPVLGGRTPEDVGTPAGQRADVVLAGMHTTPVAIAQPRRQEGIQLQLDPLAARDLFGVRAADLVGGFDGLEVLGSRGAELWEQVGSASSWTRRRTVIEQALRRWSSQTAGMPGMRGSAGARGTTGKHGAVRPEVAEAWRLILGSHGRIRMDDLATRVALSSRQLRTEFTRELGIGPTRARRLARFASALAMTATAVHHGRTPHLADIAAETGYADHAHLTREFGTFAGLSPTAWIHEERRNLQAGGHGTAQD